jgi:hypothetical protein
MHNPVFASGDRLILFCASGGRSALAAKTLVDMGFEDVCHVAGGMAAWPTVRMTDRQVSPSRVQVVWISATGSPVSAVSRSIRP